MGVTQRPMRAGTGACQQKTANWTGSRLPDWRATFHTWDGMLAEETISTSAVGPEIAPATPV